MEPRNLTYEEVVEFTKQTRAQLMGISSAQRLTFLAEFCCLEAEDTADLTSNDSMRELFEYIAKQFTRTIQQLGALVQAALDKETNH